MTATTLDSADLEIEAERIARELDIPPCPAILVRFTDEMHEPEPDMRKLAALIGNDVGLSAATLKTVNSSFYGLNRKATNIQQALAILGLRAGANLITGLLLRQAFPVGSGPLMERFWTDSMRIAETAAMISTRVKGINRDEAHTYALFRDCGMPVMIRKFADYATIADGYTDSAGARLLESETTRYGFHHARIGYALARSWLLPEPLCQAILHHHDIDKLMMGHREAEAANRKLVAFGLLAEQIMALQSGRGLCPDWSAGEPFVLDSLRIEPEEIVTLAQETLPAAA
jgi:HD-like signal output (HDOD) protein